MQQTMKKNYEEATKALNKQLAKYLKKVGLAFLDVDVSEKLLEELFFFSQKIS